MYADDTMLLSISCQGVQKLVDICVVYGQHWNICFNGMKTQCLTFGGKNPQQFKITLNNKIVDRNNNLKYLVCTLLVGHVVWITVTTPATFMTILTNYCRSQARVNNNVQCRLEGNEKGKTWGGEGMTTEGVEGEGEVK